VKKKYRKLKQLSEFVENYRVPQKQRGNKKDNLLSTSDGIASVTTNACIRPDIFLDNDRYCDGCPYLEDCQCNLKRLTTDKRRKI
jgi:hypothetical protein